MTVTALPHTTEYPGLPDLPDAACRHDVSGIDPAEFFPEDSLGDATTPTGDQLETLRAVCHRCPVADACLNWALDHDEYGIWAGTTRKERDLIRPRRCEICDTPIPASKRRQRTCSRACQGEVFRRRSARRAPINHGTAAGYAGHRRREEPACRSCTEAHTADHADRENRAARRGPARVPPPKPRSTPYRHDEGGAA